MQSRAKTERTNATTRRRGVQKAAESKARVGERNPQDKVKEDHAAKDGDNNKPIILFHTHSW